MTLRHLFWSINKPLKHPLKIIIIYIYFIYIYIYSPCNPNASPILLKFYQLIFTSITFHYCQNNKDTYRQRLHNAYHHLANTSMFTSGRHGIKKVMTALPWWSSGYAALHAPNAEARVRTLVRELDHTSHK